MRGSYLAELPLGVNIGRICVFSKRSLYPLIRGVTGAEFKYVMVQGIEGGIVKRGNEVAAD